MTRQLLFFSVLLTAAAMALSSCGDDEEGVAPTSTSAGAFPLNIQQSDGQNLALDQPPQRIVSLSTHATEILCGIGAGEQMVAVESYANCPPGSKSKPELDAYEPNLEAIAGYNPDLVYVFGDTDGIVEALRRAEIPVLYLELPPSLEGVLEQIELFGRLSGHENEAQELVQSMRERMDAVREKVADVGQGPRIFHELDPTYFTAAPNSFVGDFYNLLKAKNIAEGAADEYPQLSAEVIVQRDPEVIVLADEAGGVTADSVRQRPGWDQITAVKNNRICVIVPELVSVSGPRVVDGLEALAGCLYPERFS